MGTFEAQYGWGNEAVEAGLHNAIKDILEDQDDDGLSQIIIIGDMPANTEAQMEMKQADKGAEYWKKHFPQLAPAETLISTHFVPR